MADTGNPHPSSVLALIGPAPSCGPADHDAARAYLDRILAALADTEQPRAIRKRLHELKAMWDARARGEDPRFERAGTKAGRMHADVEAQIITARREQRAERDRRRLTRATAMRGRATGHPRMRDEHDPT